MFLAVKAGGRGGLSVVGGGAVVMVADQRMIWQPAAGVCEALLLPLASAAFVSVNELLSLTA